MSKKKGQLRDNQSVRFIYDIVDTLLSIIRTILLSRLFKRSQKIEKEHVQCVLMGNGPSLSYSLPSTRNELDNYDLIAVNNMGLSLEYVKFKPKVYVLCDPAYWYENVTEDLKKEIDTVYQAIIDYTDWELQLFLPYQAKGNKEIYKFIGRNKNIKLCFYNKTKFEGFTKIKHFVYSVQWGMPRAQNVLVASMMLSIYSGYREIFLIGVENNWLKSLYVNENNRVVDRFTHFYDPDKDGQINKWGDGVMLHDVLLMLHYMFKSYVAIENYALMKGVKIYNCTHDSYIDAFERSKMPYSIV